MSDDPKLPPYEEGYRAGHTAGHGVGFTDGKGVGYADAKLRSRLAVETAIDQLGLSRQQKDVLLRSLDNVAGKVN